MRGLLDTGRISELTERVLESIGESVIVTDTAGMVRHWNPAAERMFGYSADEAVGRPIESLTVSEPATEQAAAIMALLARGEVWSGEFACRRRDGTVFPAHVTDTPVLDRDGRLVGIVGVTRDLTAEKAAAQRLRETAALVETSAHAVIAGDIDGCLTLVNPAAELLLGTDAVALAGADVADLVLPESQAALAAVQSRLRHGEQVAPVQLSLRREDGSVVPVSVTIALVDPEGGPPHRWVATLVDLDEVEATRSLLHDQQARLTALFDGSPAAQFLCGLDGRILEANPAACALLGYAREALVGRHVTDITYPDDVARTREVIAAQVDRPHPIRFVKRYLAADGRVLSCLLHTTTITDARGRPAYLAAVVQDLTELEQAKTELQDSQQQLAAVLDAAPVRVFSLDRDGRITFLAGHGVSEHLLHDSVGRKVTDVFDDPDGKAAAAIERAWNGQRFAVESIPVDDRLWDVQLSPIRGEDDRIVGVVGAGTDVTELAAARTALSDSERLHSSLVDAAEEGIIKVRDWQVTFANRRMADMLGVPASTLVDSDLASVIPPEYLAEVQDLRRRLVDGQPVRADLPLRTTDGRTVWTLASAGPLRTETGEYDGNIVLFTDITERRALEQALTVQATRDELTGLANRLVLHDRLEHAVALRQQAGTRDLAVLCVDLDEFNDVNDSIGHATGDALLAAIGERLSAAARPDDTIARYGGDEFVIVCEGGDALDEALATATMVHGALAEPVQVEGHELLVTASIGVATMDHAADPQSLLAAADAAMYDAKRRGGRRTAVFDQRLRTHAHERVQLAAELHHALTASELACHYQPVVDLASGRAVTVETLVRWQHPERGLLTPDVFLPVAEQTGLIVPIGDQVLHHACATVAALDGPDRTLTVAVNLSAREFTDPTLIDRIERALTSSGLAANRLTLEVTETTMLDDTDTARAVMGALKDLGVRLSVDDFGSGYSFLFHLKQFPVDELKIDRSFIAGLADRQDDAAIVASVISLGRALRLATVAEGVETIEQFTTLRQFGSTHAQGNLFSPPVPAADLPSTLDRINTGHTVAGNVPTRRRARATLAVPTPVAHRILAMHHDGASLHTIAASLNRDRQLTPNGRRWHAASIATVITEQLSLRRG